MIKIEKGKVKEINDFEIPEWKKISPHYYGRVVQWYEKKFRFKAVENGKILGVISGKYESGAIYISTIMISEKSRGKGIGEGLMKKVEEWGKKMKAHKIWLNTGIDWEARKFYEKLGYKVEGKLKNHYFNKDFVIYSKFI